MSKLNLLQNTERNTRSRVGYFRLKDDGDEAIVRFMYHTAEELADDARLVHDVTINNRFYSIDCSGDPATCPLCKDGIKTSKKLFIKLINYVKDENGNIVPRPEIWTRSSKYYFTLKSYLTEYGDLTDYLFKIKRVGRAHDFGTQYQILLAPAKDYPEDIYKKDDSLFSNYSLIGGAVKTIEDYSSLSDKVVEQPNETSSIPVEQTTTNSTPNRPRRIYNI